MVPINGFCAKNKTTIQGPMLKKFISYLIIFSILYADTAHCGGLWGKEAPEDNEEPHQVTVKRKPQPQNKTGKSVDEGKTLRNPTESKKISKLNFQAIATASQGESLNQFAGGSSLSSLSNLTDLSDNEEESSATDDETKILIGRDKREAHPHQGDPEPDSSSEQNQKKDKGKGVKKTMAPAAVSDYSIPQHKRKVTTFRVNDEGENTEEEALSSQDVSDEQVLAHVQNWLKKNPTKQAVLLALSSLDDRSATKKCLNYIQERIIQGKLNRKQMAVVLLGLGTGTGVGVVTVANLIGLWFANFDISMKAFSWLYDHNLDRNALAATLVISTVSSLAVDAASRTTSLLVDFVGDRIQLFSIKKTNNHDRALVFSKICLYVGSAIPSLLPAYYLYKFFVCYGDNKCECHECKKFSNELVFQVLFASIVIETTLHYGHQLSHHVEQWINNYFFSKMQDGLPLSNTEMLRQKYLRKFQDLKRIIYGLEADELSKLYAEVFNQNMKPAAGSSEKELENLNITEVMRILRLFKAFHKNHHKGLAPKDPEVLKKTVSSWTGWGLTLLATTGRHLAFWYAVDEILEPLQAEYGLPHGTRDALSIVFGGVIGGLIQGFIERDAIAEATYDMLRGKKIPTASSHYPLRLLIKAWDYFGSAICTLPIILAGMHAMDIRYWPHWPAWAKITCLIPLGLADMFNNAKAFHDSNLAVLNATDSAISYCYPFEGYKRDKLIRITRQLRRLFKELEPSVLEALDQLINERLGEHEQSDAETIIAFDESSPPD